MLRAEVKISAGLQLIQMIRYRLEIIHSCFRIYNEQIARKTEIFTSELSICNSDLKLKPAAIFVYVIYIYIYIYISLYLLYFQLFAAVFVTQRFVASFIYFILGTIK